ncbi:DUF362 domain-containing protein [Desulfoferrobacter suflitae]|uniref:DUF362 domain-containing protein n=1 Tax=Desulfoferrobacter suflitae TaxID=2865782 RepID=UPI0021648E4D|nr:DUF362 domain-containing protein [Desulfoferrobacter suflitae]MCK8603100.1 DUF362 domain-containing protein [Desulfoferrobacter suflitae]
MASKVFHIDLRAGNDQSLLSRIRLLADTAGIAKIVKKRGLTAIKIHFGERGNTAFIRPILVRPVVDAVHKAGGKPFITDANTLYVGTRGNAADHLTTALLNGFGYSVVGAPLVIADGIDGRDEVAVPVNLKLCREVLVGSAVARADSLISLAHFKLHEAAGFGGAIKNIGMGSASRRGKMAQHSEVAPEVIAKKCIGCGTCLAQCAHGAIALVDRPADAPSPDPKVTKIVRIDQKKCVGCAGCIHACPQGALGINWEKDLPRFMERMVEYTLGTLKGKEKRTLCINFLTQISPACDCYPFTDAPIVADIGILASTDPVAIDQASMDLVNAQPPLASSVLKDSPHAAADKVKAVYPKIDWQYQLDYAEQIGLGSRTYALVKL